MPIPISFEFFKVFFFAHKRIEKVSYYYTHKYSILEIKSNEKKKYKSTIPSEKIFEFLNFFKNY